MRSPSSIRTVVVAADRSLLDPTLHEPLGVRPALHVTRWPDWLRLDRRDLSLAVTLSAVATVINVAGTLRLLQHLSPLELAELTAFFFLYAIPLYVAVVAALVALERLPIRGWRRHLATIVTTMAVTAVIAGVQYYSVDWQLYPAGMKYGITSSPLALLLNTIWQSTALTLIARAWLVKSHEESHASRLLARIRSEQMSARRRLVEGRLKAIQARVDPLFFFDMLEAVQRTYTIDVAHAEQLLDELTTFLRAALPRLRTVSSTVDQECELAGSFARLRVLAGFGESRLDFNIDPSVGAARFPPGVLLPLVDELLRTTADGDSVDISFSTQSIGLARNRGAAPTGPLLSEAAQTLVLQLTVPPNASVKVRADATTLTDLRGATAETRATLFDLFGLKADLTSVAFQRGVRTTVRIPYEPASA